MKKSLLTLLTILLSTHTLFFSNNAFAQTDTVIDHLPELGDPADRFLSPAKEAQLGERFYQQLQAHNAVVEDPEIAYYIQHLGNHLMSYVDNPKYKPTFFVVDDAGINAFAVPGGYIGVNAGLIMESKIESQLAGVMAHEIAHVNQRHIARQLADSSSRQGLTLATLLAGILLMANGSSGDAGQALVFSGIAANVQQTLVFTRKSEIEADHIGLATLHKAGFDPLGMSSFFEIIQRKSPEGADQYAFLYTHPLGSERVAAAKSRIAQLPPQKPPVNPNYELIKQKLRALSTENLPALIRNYEAKKNPTAAERYGYSQALALNGDAAKAEKTIQQLISKDKDNLYYQTALARIYRDQGKHTDAQRVLNEARTLYPDHFPLFYYYAETLKNLKQGTQCRTIINDFARKNPVLLNQTYKLLAECHIQANELAQSNIAMAEYYIGMGAFQTALIQLHDALDTKNIDPATTHEINRRLNEVAKMMEKSDEKT